MVREHSLPFPFTRGQIFFRLVVLVLRTVYFSIQDEVLSKVNHIKTMWSSVQSQVDELKARIHAAKKAASADVQAIEKIEADMGAELVLVDGGPAAATAAASTPKSTVKHKPTPAKPRRRAPATAKKPAVAGRARRAKKSPAKHP